MFEMTVRFQAPEGVRQRRIHAETVVSKAWRRGQRILVLASGHFREGDRLIGQDVSNIVLVDQDPLSLDVVRRNHGSYAEVHEANVFRYLKAAAARGERFDLVYTLGLTDYLDVRAMRLLHKMVRACLAPGGSFLLANFLPNHLGIGWMDAVMDWQLIYRDEAELTGYAGEVGLAARTWRDPTGSVVWCEMVDSG
jgi:extracellular factor (EF) 3-hydroxypalmitic acid methyl ester biosynthesis protein